MHNKLLFLYGKPKKINRCGFYYGKLISFFQTNMQEELLNRVPNGWKNWKNINILEERYFCQEIFISEKILREFRENLLLEKSSNSI